MDPLEVLACLAPRAAAADAAAACPALAAALAGDGLSDLYLVCAKSLFKVGLGLAECSGFTIWLAAFVRAAVEAQADSKATPTERAALRSLVRALCDRMAGDAGTMGFAPAGSLSACMAMEAVRRAVAH